MVRADVEVVIACTADDHSFEAEQALDEACDRRDDIINRIEKIPATTLDGMKVKLDALDSIYREQAHGLSINSVAAEPTVDMRLIIQILDTLGDRTYIAALSALAIHQGEGQGRSARRGSYSTPKRLDRSGG